MLIESGLRPQSFNEFGSELLYIQFTEQIVYTLPRLK